MRKREFNNGLSLRGEQESSTWQTQQNKIIGRDPHVSPMDFLRMTIRMISRDLYVSPWDFLRITILKIGRPLEFFALQKIGVTNYIAEIATLHASMLLAMTIFLLSSVAKAECVPTPDCASIGYTATSCEDGFVRCPFDISKLYCIPCDTTYKYTCSGTGYNGGNGTDCNGKYISCTCASGYEWNGSSCVVSCSDNSCSVGNILYSDMTCCAEVLSNKTVVGIVVKDNELVISNPTLMEWGNYDVDVSGLANITTNSRAQADMNGKSNTSVIVSAHSNAGLTSSTSAAIYCNSYTGGISETAGQWYLPAAGELYTYVYGNYSTLNPVVTTLSWSYFNSYWFWSSSEYSYRYAWYIITNDGYMYSNHKNDDRFSVSCFLNIS